MSTGIIGEHRSLIARVVPGVVEIVINIKVEFINLYQVA